MSRSGPADEPQVIPVFTLVPPDALLIDIAEPLEVLRYANLEQQTLRFDCHYIAATARQASSIGLGLDGLEPLPERLPPGAMVVISGSLSIGQAELGACPQLQCLRDWLRKAVTADIRLVTICSGALLAAAAGLLDCRQCTTHADCIAELRAIAPTASVLENRLYVEDGNRLSSAGISIGIDLMLHVVARLTSAQVALAVARRMVIYLRRSGSDPQLESHSSRRYPDSVAKIRFAQLCDGLLQPLKICSKATDLLRCSAMTSATQCGTGLDQDPRMAIMLNDVRVTDAG